MSQNKKFYTLGLVCSVVLLAADLFLLAGSGWFLPVLILSVAGIVTCSILRRRAARQEAVQEPVNDEDATPVKDRGNLYLGLIALVLVVAVTVSGMPKNTATAGMEANTSILTATVREETLSACFYGSGTLTSQESQEICLPDTVIVDAYTVKNGQTVQAGDPIARLDSISVLQAMDTIQTQLNKLDKTLKKHQDNALSKKLTARTDARVKEVYIAPGQSVADAMYHHGALLLLSLDGSMTVTVESNATSAVGQTVTVTLSDGTDIPGKIIRIQGGNITVSLTDDGPVAGDAVTVSTEDGEALGSGMLEISSPLKVTGYVGTVEKIKVRAGDLVEAGDTLLTLTDTGMDAQYQALLQQRQELEDTLSLLTRAYHDGYLCADAAGVVSGIDEDAKYVSLAGEASSGLRVTFLSSFIPEETTPSVPETLPGETVPEETLPPIPGIPTLPDGLYAGKLSKVAYGLLSFRLQPVPMAQADMTALDALEDSAFLIPMDFSPELTVPVRIWQEDQLTLSSINQLQANDKVLLTVAEGKITAIDFIPAPQEQPEDPSIPTIPEDWGTIQIPGGWSQGGSSGGSQEEEQTDFSLPEVAVCAITPNDTMTIPVSVDELDILSLTRGQRVTVTLDALPGQVFEGVLSHLDPTGSNNGGSTKYTVTVELPRTGKMLDGMNASVRMQVGSVENALTVPAAAIQEDGTRTYVYTGYDQKTGQLTLPVDVRTGASDGQLVQILSGLEAGSTVYYAYADSLALAGTV